jgi:hypothetical protein
MTKFMLLYMAPVTATEQMNVTPEELKKGMEPWLTWRAKWGKAIIDFGAPLGNGRHFTNKGSSQGSTEVTGYSIIEADSMEVVNEMVADHPHFMLPDASIEVLDIIPRM